MNTHQHIPRGSAPVAHRGASRSRSVLGGAVLLALVAATAPVGAQTKPPPAASGGAKAAPAASASGAASASPASPSFDGPVPTEPRADLDGAARSLFQEGIAAYEKGDYARAYAQLLAAWSIKKHWQVAGALGAAALGAGKPVEAARALLVCSQAAPADEKEKAVTLLRQAEAKVARLEIQPDPMSAEVKVDGETVNEKVGSAWVAYVEPGVSHRVEATFGGKMAWQPVTPEKGKTEQVILLLQATVEGPSKVPVFVLGGVGVAGLIAGGVMLGVGIGLRNQAAEESPKQTDGSLRCYSDPGATLPECDAYRAKLREANLFGQTGIGFLVGGGLVTAGASAYAAWAFTRSPKATAIQLVPAVGPAGGGLLVIGRF
ncbi:MAG: hypothetical protein IPK82_27915 [Polyangiaceae bacterium]|nr:hypothetical protein [Polyangiaceae bacterium]